MKISKEEKERLESLYQSFLQDERIKKMKEIPMHRGSNCYYHSFKVAKAAVHLGLKRKNVDLEVVLISAILHDYYLYDWRKDKSLKKGHAARHPQLAKERARDIFGANEKVQDVILTHMWPLNFKDYPTSLEAKIVSISDKSVCIREAFTSKAHKKKKEKDYIKLISKLFDDKDD